ncbi:MAG TPA: FtsX-like permease family protein, partial [Thermoleophilia bacterium]|nr:FtsX-like permease family protein [Thermoleophilia bacterium]
FGSLKLDGDVTMVNAIEPRLFPGVWHFTWLKGGATAYSKLARGAIVEEQYAQSNHLTVGSRIAALSQAGKRTTLTVVGEIRDPMIMTGVTVSQGTFRRLGVPTETGIFMAKGRPGVGRTALKAEVSRAISGFPTQTVRTETDYDNYVKKQVNQILLMLYALLAMSVTISIFGIVNTLVLSVYERTREIGMLRAIGTTRRQMRRIVRYESVITSVIGGVLGTAVGVLFGYLIITLITRQSGNGSMVFSVPYGQLLFFLVVSGMVGVLAAVLPARRAANLNVLEAVHYE